MAGEGRAVCPKVELPDAVGCLDGKHVVIRCHNYKGFYSMMLLALVGADHRFLWADEGSDGSCQISKDYELR